MSCQEAVDELLGWLEREKPPQRVVVALLELFNVPQKLFRVVFDQPIAGQASNSAGGRFQASDGMRKLCVATREGTPDWDEFVVIIQHVATPEVELA
jgi:hypothetical protein